MTHAGDDGLLQAVCLARADAPPPSCRDLAAWKALWPDIAGHWPVPMDRAVMGGLSADRLAWAFAAGYQSAIAALLPAVTASDFAAVCITEAGGAHPRAIESQLTPAPVEGAFRLNGEKRFITGGAAADVLIVAASVGQVDGRNRILVALVDPAVDGVGLEEMPPLGIVPELSHAVVRFADVVVPEDRIQGGDGYTTWIKPFRTLEDLHVVGALLGYLFAVGRRSGWPRAVLERMLALIVAVRALSLAPPLSPGVHLALAGVFGHLEDLLSALAPLWDRVDPGTARRWHRDRGLLSVAQKARDGRRTAAWRHVGTAGGA